MKFSTKTDYGLRAMIILAQRYNDNKIISLSSISKKEDISQPYLEILIAKLKKDKLVESTKGIRGGYRLAKKPEDISLIEIIECLDGPISVFECVYSYADRICDKKNCQVNDVWSNLQITITNFLKDAKLSNLI
ncbi:MAG: transcriptional regulator [Parcubacteria group bacterium]|nr:transcriptional regulator [Parcubacteria group bacterium]|tara:strand:- start:4333 stop:4734 length:402 start_codon:yes stop_codon:yes gene_type:complete